jgi:hypothetical protein
VLADAYIHELGENESAGRVEFFMRSPIGDRPIGDLYPLGTEKE